MSTILYGGDDLSSGVTISHLVTRSVSFEPVRSDDGSDYLYTKCSFDVSGIISKVYGFTTDGGGTSIASRTAFVEHQLNLPRKAFQYSVGDAPLVSWNGGPDAKNGPHPQRVVVRRVDGADVIHVDFSIDVYINTCGGGNPLYASHRWEESVDIDENAMTTYRRRGKIVTRGDIRVKVDELRYIVIPPIREGFIRIHSGYVLQSDGLALSYDYQDQEQYLMPPLPAWTAEGEYIETTNDGAKRHGECRVRLTGAKFPPGKPNENSQIKLIRLAITIAVARVKAAGRLGLNKGSNDYVAICALRRSLYKNDVEVRVKAILEPVTVRFLEMPFDLVKFSGGPAFKSKFGSANDAGTTGTAGLLLASAYLRDPCLSLTFTATPPETRPPVRVTLRNRPDITLTNVKPELIELRTSPTVSIVDSIPDDQLASINGEPGIYTTILLNSQYVARQGVIQLPVGKVGAPDVFIRTTNVSAGREVSFSARKVGAKPKIPDPSTGDPNEVLLSTQIDFDGIEPYGDGVSPVYAVRGRLAFGYRDPTIVKVTAPVASVYGAAMRTAGDDPFEAVQGLLGGPQSVTLRGGGRSLENR